MSSSSSKLTFKEAVEKTPDIANGYRYGLLALENKDSRRIIIPEDVSVDGSVFIDKETVKLYPNDSRWDYAICCNGQVFYIEVHTANTKEVRAMIKKLDWLKHWLPSRAPELLKLTDYKMSPFYWVQSSGCKIPKHLSQYKMAVANKIKPVPIWDYSVIKTTEKKRG